MTTHFGLIIIGDEILSGKRADKHLPKAIELLAARGLSLSYADYVGDDPARITTTLARAFAAARQSGDVVFSCGGIGATPDDHTRQCAARALGVELALHPQAKALITERMQDTAKEQGIAFDADRHDNIHRLNMGMFPVGADIVPNPYNKIPGFSYFVDSLTQQGPRNGLRPAAGAAALSGLVPAAPNLLEQVGTGDRSEASGERRPARCSDPHAVGERGGIHFLPGFPVMAWPMMAWVLDTHYAHLHQSEAFVEHSVIVMGSMEATLTPLMLAIEAAHAGVKVFSLPSVDHPEYGRHIELGVKGTAQAVTPAFTDLLAGLQAFSVKLGPELVRSSNASNWCIECTKSQSYWGAYEPGAPTRSVVAWPKPERAKLAAQSASRCKAQSLHADRFWHKKCIKPCWQTYFSTTLRATGDFDGKDRRRRHDNGQGKRGQVC